MSRATPTISYQLGRSPAEADPMADGAAAGKVLADERLVDDHDVRRGPADRDRRIRGLRRSGCPSRRSSRRRRCESVRRANRSGPAVARLSIVKLRSPPAELNGEAVHDRGRTDAAAARAGARRAGRTAPRPVRTSRRWTARSDAHGQRGRADRSRATTRSSRAKLLDEQPGARRGARATARSPRRRAGGGRGPTPGVRRRPAALLERAAASGSASPEPPARGRREAGHDRRRRV